MLWGLCRGVSKLRGLEQGGPHVGGSSKYEHRDRDPKIGQIQRKDSTTRIKIVMQVIKLKSCKILHG